MTEGTAKFFLLQVNDALFPIPTPTGWKLISRRELFMMRTVQKNLSTSGSNIIFCIMNFWQ